MKVIDKYEFKKVNLDDVEKSVDLYSILGPLLNNGYDVEGMKDYLREVDLYSSKSISGFLSCEYLGGCVEVHAFINKSSRVGSINLLKCFRDFVLKKYDCNTILTSVTGDYEYLVRFLGFIGFKVVCVEKGSVVKTSGTYDITYLKYEV